MKKQILTLLAICMAFSPIQNTYAADLQQLKKENSFKNLRAWAKERLAKKEEQLNKTVLFLQSDKDDKIKRRIKGNGIPGRIERWYFFQVKYPDSPYAPMPPLLVHLFGVIASPALQPRRETSTPSTFHRVGTVLETAAAGAGLAIVLVYAYRHWHLRKINSILDEHTSLPKLKSLPKDQALLILTAYDQEPALLKKFIGLQPEFVKKPTAGRIEQLQNILARY